MKTYTLSVPDHFARLLEKLCKERKMPVERLIYEATRAKYNRLTEHKEHRR